MKIQGHITAVEDMGGELKVTGQAAEVGAPEGSWLRKFEIIIRDVRGRAEAYYVGRELTITIEPERRRGS